ncbi:hypothetical protein SAMD00019534_079720, partial [Acytostelium subglobosum LB1]|uniref:hypothetical protein n=1 Tax=Acytostelium subglobosum LB1 TaxID=1410327 RepID=UPI0006451376
QINREITNRYNMYIEEIILDGFKSYAKRTVISGFDPTFNAITGLNGSGKSNILDSICFVLGITNISQVRVNNLQELVYKHGQAGITKASVSIVFNNSDTESSPVGYAHCEKITVTRQVAIGGRNKYLINGINAQANRVQNLFHSVQLNVNNPHFLIMQGRITKVINMKPPEILSMIEEAAGTRMFEVKKMSALQTIEKKQKKVEEITRILAEEITPTLEKLKSERSDYLKFTNSNTECERLGRFVIAYEYTMANQTVHNQTNVTDELNNNRKQLQQEQQELEAEIEELKKQLKKFEKKDKELDISGLEEQCDRLATTMFKNQSSRDHKREELEKERNSITGLGQARTELMASIAQKKKEKETLSAKIAHIVDENTALGEKLKTTQKKLNDFTAGITDGGDTENGSFTEQLMEAKRVAVNAASEHKQAEVRLSHLTGELTQKRALASKETSDHKRMQEERTTVAKDVDKLKKEVSSLEKNNEREQELQNRKRVLEPSVFEMQEKVGMLSAQLSGMEFTYTDPSKGFERSKVKGVVANLITLRDPETATALEICAGGKLYNIVIEDEQTGKALLAKGELKRRVTFLPLNRIENRTIEPQKIKSAEKLAGADNVKPAINLIQYDKPLQNAMNFVFGTTFIAKDKKYAQQVAFDNSIRTKTISLDGDEYNPSGTLTGGSRPSSGSILTHIKNLNEMRAKLSEQHGELQEVNTSLAQIKASSDKYKQLSQSLQLKEHELGLIDSRLQLNPHHQLIESIKEIEKRIEDDKVLLEETKKREKESLKKAEELEKVKNNFQDIRSQQQKQIEKTLAETKEAFNKSNKVAKVEQQGIEKITLEIQELETEMASLSDQAQGNEGHVSKIEKEIAKMEAELAKDQDELDTLKSTLNQKKSIIRSQNEKFAQAQQDIEKNQQKRSENELELKKIEHKASRFQKDTKDAEKYIQQMNNQYPWIKNDKHMFGKPNSDYDFKAQDPQKATAKLLHLQEDIERLSKSINKKVMSMFEKAEQEYNDLVEKKKIIENDKEKIETVIAELDEKKNESLRTTWKKVNNDFGSIFSTLLPGTNAKLEPPEGQSELDGLEVKVAFGNVWKETLSELSGGQKSLLALSLILALLRFKPAPFYILDEIDSALDLSHTANIGAMLKTHFTASQFIVVSLKEGMFNNANVLFQTKFIDGVSGVIRTTLEQRNRHK